MVHGVNVTDEYTVRSESIQIPFYKLNKKANGNLGSTQASHAPKHFNRTDAYLIVCVFTVFVHERERKREMR